MTTIARRVRLLKLLTPNMESGGKWCLMRPGACRSLRGITRNQLVIGIYFRIAKLLKTAATPMVITIRTISGGHLGRDKTLNKISAKFYWPGISQQVVSYVERCRPCQFGNKNKDTVAPELHPVKVPKATSWYQVSLQQTCNTTS